MQISKAIARRLASAFMVGAISWAMLGCGGGDGQPTTAGPREAVAREQAQAVVPAEGAQVTALTKVSEVRVGRTSFDYTFRVTVRNGPIAQKNVVAQVTGAGAGTSILKGTVSVGEMLPGQTVTPDGTITLRHDRSLPFVQAALVWKIEGEPLPESPVGTAALITQAPDGQAFVGASWRGPLTVAALDPRNRVVELAVENPTPGGSPAQVSAGYLSWMPNETDFQSTRELRVTATMAIGDPVVLPLPVAVRKQRLVFSAPLPDSAAAMADPSGRYRLRVERLAPETPMSGELSIVEHYDSVGNFTFQVRVRENSGASVEVVEAPTLGLATRAAATPAAALRANPKRAMTASPLASPFSSPAAPATALKEDIGSHLSGDSSLAGYGSSIDVRGNWQGLYTTRAELVLKGLAKDPYSGESFRIAANDRGTHKTYQIDGNCRTADECSRIVGEGNAKRAPVVLVHGFNLWQSVGGGSETWGDLAQELTARGHPVFELRWNTYMRFEEAAGVLAHLSTKVGELTGHKVIVLAHSFGGIVGHLAVQDKGVRFNGRAWDPVKSRGVFQKLITLDAPLSGIATVPSEPLGLVQGQHFERSGPELAIGRCRAITCVQAGNLGALEEDRQAFGSLEDRLKAIDPGVVGPLNPGESIRTLHASRELGLDKATPFTSVVGLSKRPVDDFVPPLADGTTHLLGDGLISLMGQAVYPSDFSANPFADASAIRLRAYLGGKAFLQALNGRFVDPEPPIDLAGRQYYFVMRAAHTSVQQYRLSCSFTSSTFCIANYRREQLEVDGHLVAHPLNHFITSPDHLAAERRKFDPDPATTPKSWLQGQVRHYGRPYEAVVSIQIRRVSDRQPITGQIALTATYGVIGFDAGAALASALDQEGIDIKQFEAIVRIDGDGQTTRSELRTVPLATVVELGTISVTIEDVVNVAGAIVDSRNDRVPVAGAIVQLRRGLFGHSEDFDSLRDTRSSRSVVADPLGRISIEDLEPGIYTALVSRSGYRTTLFPILIPSPGNQPVILRLDVDESQRPKQLNDTAVRSDQCYGAANTFVPCSSDAARALNPYQDGMLGWDVSQPADDNGRLGFWFTKLDAQGNALAVNAPSWSCVRDERTGLVWEVKTRDGGLRDRQKRYTNYDDPAVPQVPDGAGGYVRPTPAQIAAASNAIGFQNAVNATQLCGFVDWRLPAVYELQGIADYGVEGFPAIDVDWFPNAPTPNQASHWSSTRSAVESWRAWRVAMSIPDLGPPPRSELWYVRLVRGAPAAPRYVVLEGRSEVLDVTNNLVWQRCPVGMISAADQCLLSAGSYLHEAALSRAREVAFAAGKPWRVPNAKELATILDLERGAPFVRAEAFPAWPGVAGLWASTPFTATPYGWAWYAGLTGYGAVGIAPRLESRLGILLVRDP